MSIFKMENYLALLDELAVGKTEDETWVVDQVPGDGVLRSIAQLTAEEASKPMVANGSTVAAHTEHLRWSLNFALKYLQGEQPDANWDESWRVKTVTKEEWEQLQKDLKHVYEEVRRAVQENQDWTNPLMVNGTLAIVPHLAYHLGAIRQKMLMLKEKM